MSRYSQSLQAVFDAYGDDAKAALEAWANVDPEAWGEFVEGAAEKQYHADYRNHRRSLVESVARDVAKSAGGQARLFEPEESERRIEIRTRLVLEGVEHDLSQLAGASGAAIVRRIAERDLAPSLTTVTRCRLMLRVAEHVETETERLGRDVTFAEVLGWQAAA